MLTIAMSNVQLHNWLSNDELIVINSLYVFHLGLNTLVLRKAKSKPKYKHILACLSGVQMVRIMNKIEVKKSRYRLPLNVS